MEFFNNILNYSKNKLSEYQDKAIYILNNTDSDKIDFEDDDFDASPIIIYESVNNDLSIDLCFYDSIFKNIRRLNFNIDKSIIYQNMSYIQYIYQINKNNIIYTFHGFYRDGYLIIIVDSYDQMTEMNLEHKEVVIVKLNWKLVLDENKDEYYHISDIQRKRSKYTILNIRRDKLLSEKNITIDDYLSISQYKVNFVTIKGT